MKRGWKIAGISLAALIAAMLIVVLLIGYVFRDRAEQYLLAEQHRERRELLRSAEAYRADTAAYHFRYVQDTARAREIRDYFRLDTLPRGGDTWDRTLALARFVGRHIPHANQRVQPEKRNAIALWEYSREVEPAFNCRLHAIMLHELLLAEGIPNRFVTCLPADSLDRDCHVVNIVWLPEQQKWAMIDSDQRAFVAAPGGEPLSLREMRERIIAGEPVEMHALQEPFGWTPDHYLAYWAKNLYWFECWEETGYDKEPNGRGRSVALLPPGFEGFHLGGSIVRTSDDERFWTPPQNDINL